MKLLKSQRGEFVISTAVFLFLVVLAIASALYIFPCFTAKQQLDTYASELCRIAEVSGCVGRETDIRAQELTAVTGISPDIEWSQAGKIQEGQTINVTCSVTKETGLWGGIGSFPVTLHSTASGKSEVYWK
jgi:hypothetical protein